MKKKPWMGTNTAVALGEVAQGLLQGGLLSGAAVVAAFGQLFLAGILCFVALGVFLRFKRLRKKRNSQPRQ